MPRGLLDGALSRALVVGLSCCCVWGMMSEYVCCAHAV